MPRVVLTVSLLPGRLAVCQVGPRDDVPAWASAGVIYSITRTSEELSIVCDEANVPQDVTCERGWRVFKLEGPFNFGLTGIMRAVADPLADAGVSIFTQSTYNTDYVMVKDDQVEQAMEALRESGHYVKRRR